MKTINSLRSKLLALTLAITASVASFAYEFEYVNDFHIDGFGYKIISVNTPDDGEGYVSLIEIADCKKDVVIPKYVSYGDRGFHVTTFGMGSVVFTNEASSVVESITIPKTIDIINKNALAGCPNLKTVVVDSENPYYDSRENCNAIITTSQNPYFTPNTLIAGCKTTIIPNSVAEIGDNAFYNSALESITIPTGTTKIGRSAFNNSILLSSITLSATLIEISDWAFADCLSLNTIICYAIEPPTISSNTFFGSNPIYNNPTIYVPAESVEAYKNADQWKDFGQILPIEPTTDYKSQWCNKWNVMWFDGMRFDETARTSKYRLGKDTVIGDYTYSKFISGTYVRFTDDRKVYVYHEYFDDHDPYSEDLPTGEYLAYDFSAKAGDTLEVFSGIHSYTTEQCVVYDVQTDPETNLRTIMLHPLRVVDSDGHIGVSDEEITWLEGVGSPNGFLISTPLPGGGTFALLCAYQGDELKYTDSFYERFGCDYNAGVISDDLFPTLSGLQRTICREYCEQADNKTRIEQFTNLTTRTETGAPYIYYSPFLLREKDNKILIYSRSLNKDLVLYDFNLQVGDSLPMLYIDFFAEDDWIADRDMEIWCIVDYHKDLEGNILPADTLIVTDVSAITLLDGKEYKKWTFNNGMEYVEGIGSFGNRQWSGDFFQLIANRDVPTSLQGEHLVCVSKNNKLLYMMDDAEMERLGTECLCEVETSYKSQWCDTWNVLDLKYRTIKYTTEEDFETWRYYLAQDTIINNYTYTAVTRQTTKVPEGVYPFTIPEPEYVAAVRFTEDSKVYIYYDNTEYLLYDFNVQPGDELTVFAGINHYHSHHTNTIRVDEVERYPGIYPFGTEISLSVFPDFSGDVRPTCFGVTKWVEGVGDLCGFITGADCGLSEYQTALLCAYKDGNTEYTTEYEEYAEYGCEYNSGENKEYILTLPGLQRTVCNEYCGDTEDDNSANFTYKQTFDSIFFENDKPYILCNGYLLREEDNKIFLYSQSLNKDIVLYDFTLEVGDSLPAYIKDFDGTMYSDDTLVVTDISSVTILDGKEYKKWTFNNGMEYVEAIGMYGGRRNGNFFGLIQEVVVPCHIGTHLVCVSKNNKLLYQMDYAEMERLGAECLCDYDRGPLKDNAKNGKIGGRPTPTQWNMLEVETKEMDGTPTILRAETFSYTLENDSIVAKGKTFYQLARQSTKDTAITKSFVGALHFGEDEDNRVYFLRDGVEYVLYDFTAEPGDTIEIFAGINNYPQETTYTHVVTGKDTLENGACRMMLEVVFPEETGSDLEQQHLQKVWLAGLGSIDGIVHNTATRTSNAHAAPSRGTNSSETQTSVMLCAWREDSCLYTTDHPKYDMYGCVYNQDPTAQHEIHTPSTRYQKLLRNGQLFILHNQKIYNIIGIEIK
ncbi:MAG: leucine-rich repeat domain-containing protein [Paludibacteraceae bacterium]|nr:leucine-rich repeat domain-containing protein [Paludibacteraceae bacterium]